MTARIVTWLGNDTNPDGEPSGPGPSYLDWGGPLVKIRFDKDKPVLIDDGEMGNVETRQLKMHILKKAPNNRHFKVDVPEEARKVEKHDVEPHEEEEQHKPPSPPKHRAPKR